MLHKWPKNLRNNCSIQGHVDRNVWNKLGEQGFLGVSIAAEDGGIGGTFKDETIVLEEQIYAHCHAPAIGVLMIIFAFYCYLYLSL